MKKLTPEIKHVARAWKLPDPLANVPPGVEKIKVSELVSSVATVYERVRNAVDYKEEHLIRRHATGRIIRRHILLNEYRADVVAKTLLLEMIRAHYLPNDYYPETKYQEVAQVLEKYLVLLQDELKELPKDKVKHVHDLLVDMAAVEIEEFLMPANRDLAMSEIMYSIINRDLVLNRIQLPQNVLQTQVYLSTMRTYLRADHAVLSYRLFMLYYPDWKKYTGEQALALKNQLLSVHTNIQKQIGYRLAYHFDTLFRPWTVSFWMLRDVIGNNEDKLQELFGSPERLRTAVREACAKRYKMTMRKTRLRFIHAIVYLLLTKTILAFVIELPYDAFIIGEIAWLPLLTNIFFHPLVLLVIATFVRAPSQKNTEKIVEMIDGIVYGDPKRKIIFNYRKTMQRGTAAHVFFNGLYIALYIITFGLIFAILQSYHFNIVSGALFIFFLTLVSFLGLRLRAQTQELVVLEKRENIIIFIWNLFTLPIMRTGQWLSQNFNKVNIFIYLLDYLIEAPFKYILEGFEQMVGFIRDKKEEIH